MNTLTKFLAPAALALFAFNAQAAVAVDTGGESYKGNVVAEAPSQPSAVASGERVNTGGESYVGVANRIAPSNEPASAGMRNVQLERLYLG